jgi:hypothetical protein
MGISYVLNSQSQTRRVIRTVVSQGIPRYQVAAMATSMPSVKATVLLLMIR